MTEANPAVLDDERAYRAAVLAEARSWIQTPYHHHGRLKGVGVDCAMFLAEVFERVGVVAHVETGYYPHDWHLHRSEEMFAAWLARVGAERTQSPQVGDIALFRYGRTFSHGAIVTRADERGAREFIHSYIGLGVITTRSDEDPIKGRDIQIWSPKWPANHL